MHLPHSRFITQAASILIVLSVAATGCSGSMQSRPPSTTRSPASGLPTSTCSPESSCERAAATALESRPLRLRSLQRGRQSCPTSPGRMLTLANSAGPAILVGDVGVMIPQRGDISAGIVDLAPSDAGGWYGIKTHWLVTPAYGGPVVVRALSLDGTGPIAILPGAAPGPLVIPSGPAPNGADGWREEPSGSYVKQPGCYGVQFDGTSFSVDLVFKAMPAGDDDETGRRAQPGVRRGPSGISSRRTG